MQSDNNHHESHHNDMSYSNDYQYDVYRPFAVWCGWVCQVVTVLRSSLPQVR